MELSKTRKCKQRKILAQTLLVKVYGDYAQVNQMFPFFLICSPFRTSLTTQLFLLFFFDDFVWCRNFFVTDKATYYYMKEIKKNH